MKILVRLLLVLAAIAVSSVVMARVINLTTETAVRKSTFPVGAVFEAVAPARIAAAVRQLENDFDVTMVAAHFQVQHVTVNGAPAGWYVYDEVIGKFEIIDYVVSMNEAGVVTHVDVLNYRESRGQEATERQWLAQFEGATSANALKLDKDIDGVSGATLSCRHMAEGVRRVTRLIALLRADGTSAH